VKCGKAKGGAVYISCAANGEIGFHEGWIDAKESARREKEKARAMAGAEDGVTNGKAAAKPELTSAAMRYVDLHRQNAVRVELLKSPQIGLRLLVASVIGGDGLWAAQAETQSAHRNEAIASSVAGSPATAAFDAERE